MLNTIVLIFVGVKGEQFVVMNNAFSRCGDTLWLSVEGMCLSPHDLCIHNQVMINESLDSGSIGLNTSSWEHSQNARLGGSLTLGSC